MKKRIIIIVVIVAVIICAIYAVVGANLDKIDETSSNSNTSTSSVTSTDSAAASTTKDNGVLHGELVSINDNYDIDKTAVIKVKITKSYSNKTTIEQNYYNVADLIQNREFDKYSELQYWAVADMNDGSEQKVISFTLNKDTIEKIYNKEIVDNQIGNYVDELWVHPSLDK